MLETDLRQKMVKHFNAMGCWCVSVNDRFNSARPDFRLSAPPHRQLDVELKVCSAALSTLRSSKEIRSGIRKLQVIELREMNRHGVNAVGLIYLEALDLFVFCNDEFFVPADVVADHSILGLKGKPQPLTLAREAHEYLARRKTNAG